MQGLNSKKSETLMETLFYLVRSFRNYAGRHLDL